MNADWTALSQTVAHALRHQPWLYELELDAEGWTPVEALIGSLNQDRRWRGLSRADLETMMQRATKQRYELDGDRIRARYGHSVPGRIVKTPGAPPPVLFHGTAAASVPVILSEGLKPMRRQYVHLSVDRATARSVGRRKGPDVTVLLIRASEAHTAGVRFWVGNEMVWLADAIPAAYISEDTIG